MLRAVVPVVLALLAALAGPSAHAQWKWKGANGQVQYSDVPPPPGTPERDILQRPGAAGRAAAPTTPVTVPAAPAASAAAPTARAPSGVDSELDAKRRAAQKEADDKRKSEEARVAAAKAENCSRAREYIRTLESGVRLTRTNDKGEREFFDDATRAEEMRRAREAAGSNC